MQSYITTKVSTLGIYTRANLTEKAEKSSISFIPMKETFVMEKPTDKESIHMQMEDIMKANGKIISKKEKGLRHGPTVSSTKENTLTD